MYSNLKKKTFFEEIASENPDFSWKIYAKQESKYTQSEILGVPLKENFFPLSDLKVDAENNTLPSFAFIEPCYEPVNLIDYIFSNAVLVSFLASVIFSSLVGTNFSQ